MNLTERDREILIALTLKVRLLSLHQIARTWWKDSATGIANTRKRIKQLEDAGYIARVTSHIHPELPLEAPLIVWRPGDPDPNFQAIAYQLKIRWNQAIQPTLIFIATQKAARVFGGFGGKLHKPLQTTHDLHVGSIYLKLLQTDPEAAKAWISEEQFAPERRHQKLPDAVLQDASGAIVLVIEFAGSYDAKHVERVHVDSVKRALPYELW